MLSKYEVFSTEVHDFGQTWNLEQSPHVCRNNYSYFPRSLLSWCVPSVCDGYQTGEQIQKSTEKNTKK